RQVPTVGYSLRRSLNTVGGARRLERRRRSRRSPLKLGQRQIWHDAVRALLAVNDHLGATLEHLFHGLEIEAAGGNILGLEIFGEYRLEPLRFTRGAGGDLLLVGLRLLQDALSLATGTWDDVVGKCLGLVLCPLAVSLCPLDVAERVDDLGRRIGLL